VPFFWLIVSVLFTWRVTHLLTAEDGPWMLLARLRRWAEGGLVGKLLACFYCASMWVAIPLAWWIGEDWPERIVIWPALSGGAILLERATSRAGDDMATGEPPVAHYSEDREKDHGMRLQKQPDEFESRR
jgi:hypothetical protein